MSYQLTSHAEIKRALSFIPADLPREDWVAIGDAIKTEGLDFSVFDSFSATADSYNPKECRQQWQSFKGKHTAGTIFFHAKQYGYKLENNGEKPDYQAIEKRKAEQAKKAAEQAKATAIAQLNTAKKCADSFATATDAPANHPYLLRKQIPAIGIKVDSKNNLLIPVFNSDYQIISLQTISPNGQKLFTKESATKGGFFLIGEIYTDCPIRIAEGYSKAVRSYLSNNEPVFIAFSAGNLAAVASMVRNQYPNRDIIINADNNALDSQGNPRPADKNTGLLAANHAAKLINGFVCVPYCSGSDFDDVFSELGHEETVRQLSVFSKPNEFESTPRPVPKPETMPNNYPDYEKNSRAKPVYSVESEQAVLSSLILDNSMWGSIANLISKDDFYDGNHKIIFHAIASLVKKQSAFDYIMLCEWVGAENKGLLSCLKLIAAVNASPANITSYAQIVKNYSVLRKTIAISKKAIELSRTGGATAKDILAELVVDYNGLLAGFEVDTGGGITHIKKIISNVVDNIEVMFESDGKDTGLILTPWVDFNEKWGGFPEVGTIGIAGRPGMGKTTAMQNFIEWYATSPENKGKPIIIFSMDMQPEELVVRFLSSLSKIDIKNLSSGKLEDDDWPRLTSAINLLANTEIYIDGSSLTVDSFQSKVENFAKEIGMPAIIVVDYLQQITIREMQNNPIGMMEEVSKRLKKMQKDWGVLLIALLQLNRNLESRPNKRPMVSDIRGSGQIEQDLEAIYLLYRDEVYNEDSPDKGVAEIIGGKVRKGELGTVRLVANLKQSRFENHASARHEESNYD